VSALQRAKFLAFGTVQGVGFREFCRRIGKSCGLSGYAKNLPDGTVEIAAEGTGEKIGEFCRRICVKMEFGIRVEKLQEISREKTSKASFASFSIAH